MKIPANLFPGAPLSAHQLERRAAAETIRTTLDALKKLKASDPYRYSTNLIDLKQLVVSITEESQFYASQLSAHIVLRQLVRQPPFTAIVRALNLTSDNWTLISEEGLIFQVYEVEKRGGIFLEFINITEQVRADASLKTDAELVAKNAFLTGAIVSSSNRVPLLNWLQFQQLSMPKTIDEAHNLIALLELTLPSAPTHGNYWGVCGETGETKLVIDDDDHSQIYQAIYKLLQRGDTRREPLINYLTNALLKQETATFLREYPEQSWTLLIETDEAKAFAQSCLDALDLPQPANASPISTEQRSRLLIAALMLDFSLGRADKNQSFVAHNIYTSSHVHANAHEIRKALQQMLTRHGVNEPAVPLATQLILAGLAPECLVRAPAALQIGTPGWVMLRKSVLLAESIAPGLSRQISYEKLLELGAITPVSTQQEMLHDWANLQAIKDWATLNEVDPVNADVLPTQEIIKQAAIHYNAHIEAATTALDVIATPPVSRRKLAIAVLNETGCPPLTQVELPRDRRYKSQYYSVLDIYMTRNLLRLQEYDTRTGKSIYQKSPSLLALEPINTLYTIKVKEHFEKYKSAIATVSRLAMSRLPLEDRLAIEHGELAIYHVRNTRPHAGSGSNNPPRDAANTGSFGVVILCRLGTQISGYELFPLQGICRRNPELAKAYTQGRTLDRSGWYTVGPNGDDDPFKSLTFLNNAVVDMDEYFKGSEQRDEEEYKTTGVLLERFAELESLPDRPPYLRSPLQSFHSERFNMIGEKVANHNPPTTYDQFYATGYDKTKLQERLDQNDNIVDTFLNIIIPFKQCIEGIVSGDRERHSETVFSCVMDLTAILFVFAGAVGPFSKALASSSKLLNLSKVGSRFLLSAFNPLDGVPTLAYGGAKLVGKGVMKLSHFGHFVTKAGAGQLRALTATTSGSYDLVRALNKTGVAADIRMTLPTVAHARALFNDDALETVEHIVARLSGEAVSVPKGTSSAELQHLFNNATREATQSSKGFRDLESLIGHAAANDVLITFTKSKGPQFNGTKFTTNAGDYSDTLGFLAELETKKINYLKSHQQSVLKLDLGKPPYTDVMPESAFNPQGFTDHAQRAGAWMVKGSTSDNELEHIVAILREYTGNNKSLTDAAVVKEIHSRLVPQLAGTVREAGAPSKYGSSVSGYALLEQHLKQLDAAHDHFDKHLLAAIAGFQGFGDGNGRTASAVYAISQLRNNRFTPMPKHVFILLSDLG
ncbi:hypothetical protein [Pseudomonas sp. H1h]|uniref:hypothetical protein n=1 Tax=Pseudomonas sp. H1h TaxID=1397280 RepID=UPI000ABE10A6|nr:hypothetical protein [Pseudomonas sp. H1h]